MGLLNDNYEKNLDETSYKKSFLEGKRHLSIEFKQLGKRDFPDQKLLLFLSC